MEPLSSLVVFICVSLVIVTTGQGRRYFPTEKTVSPEIAERSESLCKSLVKDPFFEPEMVVGTPWRVYYAWNMDLHNKCIDIRFKIATPLMIRRFYYDMNDYLEEQPAWGAASLLLKMGRSRREMLLFDDQGLAGRFLAVPNTLRDGSMLPIRIVPLLKFQMKLTRNGKYLIFMDCQIGIASIAARIDQSVDRAEIDSVAAAYGAAFGKGYRACYVDYTVIQ